MVKKVTTIHFILSVISIIIGTFMIGCELPTEPIQISFKVNVPNFTQFQRGCELAIVPDLPEMEETSCPTYIFYIPAGTIWNEISIPISYTAPERDEVEWNINWAQMDKIIPPFYSYSDFRCQGEIDILIYPPYVGWAANITADTGTEFDSIIIVVEEEGTIDNEKQ
jgi:hypothetical protein